MKNKIKLFVTASLFIFSFVLKAKENIGTHIATSQSQTKSLMSLCAPASAKEDLDINNVRATIMNGGDMWWDLVNGKYLVPKPAPGTNAPTSLYAGSLWIGGIDANGALKVAAMTYRQTGNDFWPGPLNSSASTDAGTCLTWDKIFKINKADVKTFRDWIVTGGVGANPTSADAVEAIVNWPVTGPEGQAMAPYYDANANGVYDPYAGDYPDFWLGDGTRPAGQSACDAGLYGDQVLYWVFNDKGNVHTQTGGAAIGLEIQAQAFAFQTNDAINNMTFYHYTIINKSSFRLDSTYFGVWVDADLGSASDDYVGCDVGLGLGYCYNGDLVDDNPPSGQIPYGANPPAIGCDFFEGPYADPNGIDDLAPSVPASYVGYGDTTIDNERIGMSKFVYYNNGGSFNADPVLAIDYYHYLCGKWMDGTGMTYGGDGHLGSVECDYSFPGSSDQPTATSPGGFGTGGSIQAPWSEETESNVPADRRFLQSAGPFTLQPGAINTITTGLVWARATQGGNLASVTLMKGADAKAQDLFDNCFALLNGPDAPNLAIQELSNELILTWTNPITSNNYNETYSEDYNKSSGLDKPYSFQGYIIYQLKDETVSPIDLYDVDKARVVFQCDIHDSIKQIVNFTNDVSLQALVPQEMVNGADNGVVHSISLKEDKFAVGNTTLVNHKTYYFAIVAYGFSPTVIPDYDKPKDYFPFISGNKFADGYFNHSAIPHIPAPESGGTETYSTYGMGPKLTRIEGHGNGGQVLDFTNETVLQILNSSSSRVIHPVYDNTHGPVNIKVVDPLNVPKESNFEFQLYDTLITPNVTSSAIWRLVNLTTNDTVYSAKTIATPYEQVINGQPSGQSYSIPTWGISVNVAYASEVLSSTALKGGFLEGTISYADDTKQWLTGLVDEEGDTYSNWIRSGTAVSANPIFSDVKLSATEYLDPNQDYENIINKTWAPYRLCATGLATDPLTTSVYAKGAPAWPTQIILNKISNIASVDVVITNDKSLWTRCPVLEESDDDVLSVGNARKLMMRDQASVDKNGTPNFPSPDNNDFAKGMSWFPGYAINLETGERLNMAFGEDSWLAADNGNDMMWNPSTTKYAANGDPIFGGKHFIYVFGHNGDGVYSASDPNLPGGLKDVPRYDQGKAIHDLLFTAASLAGTAGDPYKREVFTDAMWVNIPMLVPGHTWRESTVKFRLRVAKPYQLGYTTNAPATTDLAATPENKNWPMYTFNTSDIETHTNDGETAVNALDLINIVPNPYYAYSAYEKKALENLVKITNLPEKCSIAIYTLNGTLIRKFNKDDPKTSLDWDLKNQARVPIASGMYIIYVKVPDVGERTLKWFGVIRPTDLDSY